MTVKIRAVVILTLCALLIGSTFYITMVHVKSPAVQVTEQEIVSTTTEQFTMGLHAPGSETKLASPSKLGWIQVLDKMYGYSYPRPEEYNGTFEIEAFEDGLTLEAFVAKIWKMNNGEWSQSITPFEPVVVSGLKGYQFMLKGGFDHPNGGYILSGRHRYLFFENINKVKLVVHYQVDVPDEFDSEYMLNNMVIDKNLIPVKQTPIDWQSVSTSAYSFQYPANLFSQSSEVDKPNTVFLVSKEESVYGNMYVSILEHAFDPKKIEGMYGPITDPKEIVVGDRKWYAYGWGDAGCASQIIETEYKTKTLQVSFGGCMYDEVYPVRDDEALQKEILSRFDF